MSKLVRDRIPELIRAKGEPCVAGVHFFVADRDDMADLLMTKLREEVDEYDADRKRGPTELVDILEVVWALAREHGMTVEALEEARHRKAMTAGGFTLGIVLASVPQHVLYECAQDCDDPYCNYCRGGLASCTVCHGAEGTLLPSCPGYGLSSEALDAIYAGSLKTVDDLMPEHRCPE